ncbi:MAG: hypothetical protein KDK37_17590, partial [Leptospiraceae bacterium]|nr:hypothetical protein [Leptospiraceae bacterium]
IAEPAPYVEPFLGRWQTAASSTCQVALEVYRDEAGNLAFDLKGQSLVRSGAANVSGTELALADVGAMQYDDATPSLGMSNIDENNSRRFSECNEDYLFFLRGGN